MRTIKPILISIIFFLLTANSYTQNNHHTAFKFDLNKPLKYKISIEFFQQSKLASFNDYQSSEKQIDLQGILEFALTITPTENYDNEYYSVICRFDNFKAEIINLSDTLSPPLKILSSRNNVMLYHNDSLIANYNPGINSSEKAEEFYQELMFVGEDISMLVYPTGEIINITQNKNLWDMATQLIDLSDQGILQIIFPDDLNGKTNTNWGQSQEINYIGDYKLQSGPDPLITKYKTASSNSSSLISINFEGATLLENYRTEITTPELDITLNLYTDNFSITREGFAEFSKSSGHLLGLEYNTSKNGSFEVIEDNSEKFEIYIDLSYHSKIKYNLIED